MNIEISGRNYEVTDRIRNLITTKLDKIAKYFDNVIEIRVVLHIEKYRNICEILVNGREPKTMQEADSMEEAVQLAVDHLKVQGQKEHKKIRDHHRRRRAASPDAWQVNVLEPSLLREGDKRSPRIVRTDSLPIRPMSIEEAALRLGESRNEFIVFRDLDTEKVTVIYKRRDNNFGMISPEF
jgi:putative sigma-54 modulation protein